ncbi:MAG: hypothetical protein E6I75_16900 [Chloroflexi bacterium]|nr:MAG: hypothetical protein E6I75_16900 [Chloroflexota bacterium]
MAAYPTDQSWGVAKEKVTITLDRAKADRARALVGARSTSEVVDIALDRLVRAENLRSDVEAYRRMPQTEEDEAWASIAETSSLADDTDWESLYAGDDTA